MAYLFHCPQMAPLAEKIAAALPDVAREEIQWREFVDGFPNLEICRAKRLRNQPVFFLASFDTPAEIFKQLAVIYELPRLSIRSLCVMLPFYPTGTMERVEREGQIATASTLARMLSATPISKSGPLQIVIYDIHALQERFYFDNTVIPRLETAIPLLKRRIADMPNVAVVFPDQGAWKRFGSLFSHYPMVVCHKVREGDRREVRIKEGDPSGRHAIIIDDLVMTGGTLRECRNALVDAGAADVSAYVTHGVFPAKSWRHFVGQGWRHFWLTDSCPLTAAALQGQPPFEVLCLADALVEILAEETVPSPLEGP
ncbi:MAG: phosphoribosyltransferase family protein [Desulfosarcinaceae bacterium]|nr:phosphoribosyltransferase family protein [Desulfosarcinaceae bacterium]